MRQAAVLARLARALEGLDIPDSYLGGAYIDGDIVIDEEGLLETEQFRVLMREYCDLVFENDDDGKEEDGVSMAPNLSERQTSRDEAQQPSETARSLVAKQKVEISAGCKRQETAPKETCQERADLPREDLMRQLGAQQNHTRKKKRRF